MYFLNKQHKYLAQYGQMFGLNDRRNNVLPQWAIFINARWAARIIFSLNANECFASVYIYAFHNYTYTSH